MKETVSTAFIVLLSAVLVLFGIFYGAYHGWSNEYEQVQAAFEADNGLNTELAYRGNNAANLKTVALRHIAKDEAALVEIENARNKLMDTQLPLSQRYQANIAMEDSMQKLMAKLRSIESVKQSERDLAYLNMIEMDMANLAKDSAANYNQLAKEYNSMLANAPSGLLARILGVRFADVFE